MTTLHLVDPEILPIIEMLPRMEPTLDFVKMIRAVGLGIGVDMPPPPLTPETHHASGHDGAPDVRLLVYKPPSEKKDRAAILHIHGGGMIIGTADMSLSSAPRIALANDAVIVSVDYRLAPETPFPGPQEDCYVGYLWLLDHAAELGVDPTRISVMGESAGGGLAAALALIVRDRGVQALAGQVLIYPMLDHRTGGHDCQYMNPMTGEFIWTPALNQFGWTSLRGDFGATGPEAGHFSPALASDLTGLPPTYISVGALDLFLDEDLDYARRLSAAGVPVELHVYPGAIHGFDMAAGAAVAQQSRRDLSAGITRLLAAKG
jgi:acetyl esterase